MYHCYCQANVIHVWVCFLQDSTSSVSVHLYKCELIFSGNDKQLDTVTDSTELNADNLAVFNDPLMVLNQPSLQDLIESEPLAGDDPPPMSPTIPSSTINVDLTTSAPSMSAECSNNKSCNQSHSLPTTPPYQCQQ